MAITTETYAEQLGSALVGAAQDRDEVLEVWVSTRTDGVDLWLLTSPIELDTERRLYGLLDTLYAQFDGTGFDLHVLNPRYFRGDPRSALPQHAVKFLLRAV